MLPEEYEQRRRLPPHLRPQPEPEPEFSYRLRAAIDNDVPALREMYNHFVTNSAVTFEPTAITLAAMRSKLDACTRYGLPFTVAEAPSGQLIGMAYVQPWSLRASSRRVVEDNFYVGPAASGRGLGRVLLADLIEKCRDAGVKRIISVISDKNADASIHLHEALGFEHVGHMGKVGYKYDRWLGTVMLELKLSKKR